MQEHIDLVRTNFQYVFKDIMDLDHFEENMLFSDPISKFTFFRGYQFNVQFLRYFLAPIYELHEVRQAGENAILVKWSWTMNFWWNRFNPLKIIWDPRLVFSGFSVLGYNPATGKWNKHVDGWDCLEDQEYFSVEGFSFVMGQMLQLSKPPNRVTPEFIILKKYKDWEIRRYKPFLVAEVDSAQTSLEVAEEMLRDFFRGENAREQYISRTTPLFRDSNGKLFFMLPGYVEERDAPAPKNEAVKLRIHPGGLCGGIPSDKDIEKQIEFIRARAKEEGSQPQDKEPWLFARYNEPKWPRGPFRRNDFLVPIEESSIELWRSVSFDFIERIVDQDV
ncbi:g3306 [Coccomyxa elongata]